MKKIILLLFIPLIISGCYDYNQLNDLAIIAGIGIDYIDDEFKVTFEVISTKKEGETSGSNNTYYVSSSGKNLVYAFTNAANKMDKVPYFEHVEIVIFSKNVAQQHLEECVDYLIRTEKLRNEFYTAISENEAGKLLSTNSKEHPIISNYLVELLKFNNETFNAAYYIQFTKTLNSILTDGEDAMLPVFKLDNDIIELKGLGIFKDFELKHIFNNDEASLINLLNNFKVEAVHINMSCENKNYTSIAIYKSDFSIEAKNNEILVNGIINARISEDTCGYNFKEASTYQILENKFSEIIADEINDVIKILKASKSNVLNIGKNYYNKSRIKDFDLWTTQQFKYDINLKINKKGLTFEVET